MGAIRKTRANYLETVDKVLRDTNIIGHGCGCTRRRETLAVTAYLNYLETQIDYAVPYDYDALVAFKQPTDKIEQIDSFILFHEIKNEDLLDAVLLARKYTSEHLLDQIINLAFDAESPAARTYVIEYINQPSFQKNRNEALNKDENTLSEGSKIFLKELQLIAQELPAKKQ